MRMSIKEGRLIEVVVYDSSNSKSPLWRHESSYGPLLEECLLRKVNYIVLVQSWMDVSSVEDFRKRVLPMIKKKN